MERFSLLPVELRGGILKRLPLADRLELRLVSRGWNELSTSGLELMLIWEEHDHQNAALNLHYLQSAAVDHRLWRNDLNRISSVTDLQQSQLASRVYKLMLICSYDRNGLRTIRDLGACFDHVFFQRPLQLQLRFGQIQQQHFYTSLAQDGSRFQLVKLAFAALDGSANQQRVGQATNYFLDNANHLQDLDVTSSHLVTLQRLPHAWNETVTTLQLYIKDPVRGAACMQMVAVGMRNLQTATFYVSNDLPDKRFFMPLSGLPELRTLTITGYLRNEVRYLCELPVFATPGLQSLQTLRLWRVIGLARDRYLFKRLPRLESLSLYLLSDEFSAQASPESESREAMNILIDNCNAGSLPSLRLLEMKPFFGRMYGPDHFLSPTLDFDFAQIITAAAKCPKLEILKLTSLSFGALTAEVLLPSLEQCPVDYLLASPREIRVNFVELQDFLSEPQYLLDYALGMQRTGLQRLRIDVGRRGYDPSKREATQRMVTNTIRLLALDLPKLSPDDIEQKSVRQDVPQLWSESIVFIERDSGRRHELCLTTMLED